MRPAKRRFALAIALTLQGGQLAMADDTALKPAADSHSSRVAAQSRQAEIHLIGSSSRIFNADMPQALPKEPAGGINLVRSAPELQPNATFASPTLNSLKSAVDSFAIPSASGNFLSLDELQSLAVASNPTIQQAAAAIQATRGRAYQVGLQANPEVGIDFQQLGSGGQAEQYGVTLGQRFVRRDKRNLDRSVQMHEVQRLNQMLVAKRQQVLTDVHLAFIRVLRAQRQIDVTRELVEIAQAANKAAAALLDAQEVARTDLLRAEVDLENATLDLRDAENRHIAAWRSLEAVIGQSQAVKPLGGDLFATAAELDFESSLAALRMQSPEISAALAAIERARCQLRREQIEPLPDVSVGGLLNWRDNGIGGDPDAGIAVSVPVPVWDKNRGAIQEARYQLVAAERELNRVELSLASRLAPVFERYQTAKIRSERIRETIIPKTRESAELVRSTYELGEVGIYDVLETQRTYAQARLNYIDAAEALRLAEAEIGGLLLSGSLTP